MSELYKSEERVILIRRFRRVPISPRLLVEFENWKWSFRQKMQVLALIGIFVVCLFGETIAQKKVNNLIPQRLFR